MTTVDFEPLTVAVPLREEPPGVFRVGKSRVLLELVIHAFKLVFDSSPAILAVSPFAMERQLYSLATHGATS